MDRREFLRTTAAAVPAIAAGTVTGAQGGAAPSAKRTFKLKYAPHFGMFEATAGKDLFDQLRFMADQGFRAFEDNGLMGRPADVQQKIGDTLAKLGMTMGVFVIDGGDNWKVSLATGKQEFKDVFLKACRSALDTQKRVNAQWATVVPGYFARELPMGLQTGHVVDALRAGAEILEPSKLAMVLEPLSDNPDLFLRTSDQAYAVCRAVNSPSCKILYDMFHMQRNEGDMITRIELAWNEIAYFQIGDNPGRKEPGTGEVNYRNIFKFIRDRAQASNREFVLGMEHGNFFPGAEGEQKLIEAYVRADDF
jgi:hydroxypyruvate isomerase